MTRSMGSHRLGRSSLIFCLYSKIIEALDADENYDVKYLDFSIVFEEVPHLWQILKLLGHGVDRKSLELDQDMV